MAGFFNRIMSKFQAYDDQDMDMEYDDYTNEEGVQFHEPSPHVNRQARVVDFKHSQQQGAQAAAQQVIVIKPDSMESAQEITLHIRSGRTVICNFEQVDPKVAQRVIDFVAGASYALDGKLHPITSTIFTICPRNVVFMNNRDQHTQYQQRQAYGM